MKLFRLVFIGFLLSSLSGCNQTLTKPASIPNNHSLINQSQWSTTGSEQVIQAKINSVNINNNKGAAKNIILFIGDGMGVSTVTAARIFAGQQLDKSGEEHQLSFDKFPFTGLIKTYNTNQQTPDSAGTMTAIMTGVKTKAGVIGVSEQVIRGKCRSIQDNQLITALELAEISGKKTAIVTNTRVTHATPAATYAKAPERNWEDTSDMPKKAIKQGCLDIAHQLVHFEMLLEKKVNNGKDHQNIDGIDIIMGGGRRHFLRKIKADNTADAKSKKEGDRKDGRNLINEWQNNYPNGNYIIDQAGFDKLNTNNKLLALFNESHMRYEADRHNDKLGEPSLSEMTKKAVKLLENNNDKGYFLMVESGRIDHAHHAGNAYNALHEAAEFSKAIQHAVDSTNQNETLIIVTADHSHVFTIAGYPTRGNPILGKVIGNDKHGKAKTEPELAADGLPYTTVGYANGRGFQDLGTETNANKSYKKAINAGRHDLTHIHTEEVGYHQESLVPLDAESHGAEDVGIYAIGPGAHLVSGTNEQNIIFHIMDYAGNLTEKAQKALNKP